MTDELPVVRVELAVVLGILAVVGGPAVVTATTSGATATWAFRVGLVGAVVCFLAFVLFERRLYSEPALGVLLLAVLGLDYARWGAHPLVTIVILALAGWFLFKGLRERFGATDAEG